MKYEVQANGAFFTVQITRFYPGRPAKLSGPWENCYPEESPEIEFDVLSAVVLDEFGEDVELAGEAAQKAADDAGDDLYDAVMDRHLEEIRESACDYY